MNRIEPTDNFVNTFERETKTLNKDLKSSLTKIQINEICENPLYTNLKKEIINEVDWKNLAKAYHYCKEHIYNADSRISYNADKRTVLISQQQIKGNETYAFKRYKDLEAINALLQDMYQCRLAKSDKSKYYSKKTEILTNAMFLTLTVDDSILLKKGYTRDLTQASYKECSKEFTLFVKRLKRALNLDMEKINLEYLVTFEGQTRTGRCHCHAIVVFVDKEGHNIANMFSAKRRKVDSVNYAYEFNQDFCKSVVNCWHLGQPQAQCIQGVMSAECVSQYIIKEMGKYSSVNASIDRIIHKHQLLKSDIQKIWTFYHCSKKGNTATRQIRTSKGLGALYREEKKLENEKKIEKQCEKNLEKIKKNLENSILDYQGNDCVIVDNIKKYRNANMIRTLDYIYSNNSPSKYGFLGSISKGKLIRLRQEAKKLKAIKESIERGTMTYAEAQSFLQYLEKSNLTGMKYTGYELYEVMEVLKSDKELYNPQYENHRAFIAMNSFLGMKICDMYARKLDQLEKQSFALQHNHLLPCLLVKVYQQEFNLKKLRETDYLYLTGAILKRDMSEQLKALREKQENKKLKMQYGITAVGYNLSEAKNKAVNAGKLEYYLEQKKVEQKEFALLKKRKNSKVIEMQNAKLNTFIEMEKQRREKIASGLKSINCYAKRDNGEYKVYDCWNNLQYKAEKYNDIQIFINRFEKIKLA